MKLSRIAFLVKKQTIESDTVHWSFGGLWFLFDIKIPVEIHTPPIENMTDFKFHKE